MVYLHVQIGQAHKFSAWVGIWHSCTHAERTK